MKYLILLPLLLIFAFASGQTPHWNSINSGTSKNLYSIAFGTASVGYAGGKDGILIKSIDSGATWIPIAPTGLGFSQSSPDIIDIQFVDEDNGYAILSAFPAQDYIGKLYETADGGQSWIASNDTVTIAAARTYFFSKGNGFLVGSAFFAGNVIARMEQGTWTDYFYRPTSSSSFNYGIAFLNPQTGIIGGDGGNFYRTVDGGQSWDTVYSGSDSSLYSIQYLNDSTIIAATGHGNRSIIISRDHGATWNDEVNSFSFAYPIMESIVSSAGDSIISVGHTTNETIAASGTNGSVYWYNGTIWQEETFPFALHDVARQSSNAAFAVGDSGLILTNRAILGTGISDAGSLRNKVQIFPNPTNGMLYLHYENIKVTRLALIDISGKEIKTFAPQSKQLDISALPRGNYFLCLSAGEGKIVKQVVLK